MFLGGTEDHLALDKHLDALDLSETEVIEISAGSARFRNDLDTDKEAKHLVELPKLTHVVLTGVGYFFDALKWLRLCLHIPPRLSLTIEQCDRFDFTNTVHAGGGGDNTGVLLGVNGLALSSRHDTDLYVCFFGRSFGHH